MKKQGLYPIYKPLGSGYVPNGSRHNPDGSKRG